MSTILYYISGIFLSKRQLYIAVIEEHEEWLKVISTENQELRIMMLDTTVTEIGEIITECYVSNTMDYCLLPREQIEDALRIGKLWKTATPPKLPLPPFGSMN